MDDFIHGILSNPNDVSFAVLFIGLFIWVMKTNNEREIRYQETIKKLTESLEDVGIIKTMVENINSKFKEEKEEI